MDYAVITGASRGIGRTIAEKLLKEGYYVIANYGHDDAAAEETLTANLNYKDRFILIKQSLSSYSDACDFANYIKTCSKHIKVLICNSATTDFTAFPEVTYESWKNVLDTNLTAPAFLIQQLLPFFTERTGRVIMLGSNLARYPHARSVSYGVSKAGIHALTKYLVKYLSPKGVTINCISPGTIQTSWHDEKTAEHRKRIEDKIALHRFGEKVEIAELCMEIIKNQYINGSIIDIDGGYSFE